MRNDSATTIRCRCCLCRAIRKVVLSSVLLVVDVTLGSTNNDQASSKRKDFRIASLDAAPNMDANTEKLMPWIQSEVDVTDNDADMVLSYANLCISVLPVQEK